MQRVQTVFLFTPFIFLFLFCFVFFKSCFVLWGILPLDELLQPPSHSSLLIAVVNLICCSLCIHRNAPHVLSNDSLIMSLHSSSGGVKPPVCVCALVPVTYVHAVCVSESPSVCLITHPVACLL